MIVSIDKTYKTRCGYDVKIYAIYENQTNGVHGAYFEKGYDRWCANTWKLNGSHLVSDRENDIDLVEVKPRIKRTYWINLYPNPNIDYVMAHSSKAKADNAASSDRIACVKREIDCEEGEGL